MQEDHIYRYLFVVSPCHESSYKIVGRGCQLVIESLAPHSTPTGSSKVVVFYSSFGCSPCVAYWQMSYHPPVLSHVVCYAICISEFALGNMAQTHQIISMLCKQDAFDGVSNKSTYSYTKKTYTQRI